MIRRSLRLSVLYAFLSIVALALAVILVAGFAGIFAYLGSLPLALFAVLFGVASVSGAWRAPCPTCGDALAFPELDGSRRSCRRCGCAVESRAGRVLLRSGR